MNRKERRAVRGVMARRMASGRRETPGGVSLEQVEERDDG